MSAYRSQLSPLPPTIATSWLGSARGWGRSLPPGFRSSGRKRPSGPGPVALESRGTAGANAPHDRVPHPCQMGRRFTGDHGDSRGEKQDRPLTVFQQVRGRSVCVWRLLGSNQRRLSRQIYRLRLSARRKRRSYGQETTPHTGSRHGSSSGTSRLHALAISPVLIKSRMASAMA
jgi:hypothetical protein